MLVDTHAHLFFEDFKDDLDLVIARAKKAGVRKIIVPGTSVQTSRQARELAKKYPGVIYPAVGVHPEEVVERGWALPLRDDLERAVAIGEIGMDGYSAEMQKYMNEQGKLFKAQCLLALEYDLPVIIHTRNSFAEVWGVLESLPAMPRGQFHCFSVDEEALDKIVEAGFYVSFGGNITWSRRVANLVPKARIDRILLETDSPLLVPRDKNGIPMGKSERNEPANVRYLAQKIAELRGSEIVEIEKMTTENAKTLFKL